MNVQGITPSVATIYGCPTLSLAQVAHALGMARRTAEREVNADRFPIPHLPRRSKRAPYRFSAWSVDRYLRRTHR